MEAARKISVSVILPVYNGQDYLKEAIDSVIAQSMADFELILVDDGSTDRSPSICDAVASADSRVKVLHTSNGGLSVARNRGVDACCGDVVMFVDADDRLHPDALRWLSATMLATGADMVIGGFAMDERRMYSHTDMPRYTVFTASEAISNALYQQGIPHAAWGKLYRRSIFSAERFTAGLYYEDLDFFYRACMRCNRIAFTAAPLYYYRQHGASIMHTWSPRRLDVLTVTERMEAAIVERCPDILPAARDRRLSANFNIFIFASLNGVADVADTCWHFICTRRFASLVDKNVRFKNKAGIGLSYLGRHIFMFIARWVGM